MILFVDDEVRNTERYRENLKKLDQVHHLTGADDALAYFYDEQRLAGVSLVILDLGMYTGKHMEERASGYGRITGEVLRQELRTRLHWTGPIIVLSNSPDEGIRRTVEEAGDTFRRKPLTTPIELRQLAEQMLSGKRR